MSRIIQVYDEEKEINTQVSCFKRSTDTLSPPTEAPRNVLPTLRFIYKAPENLNKASQSPAWWNKQAEDAE